jgi:hypothetical protein
LVVKKRFGKNSPGRIDLGGLELKSVKFDEGIALKSMTGECHSQHKGSMSTHEQLNDDAEVGVGLIGAAFGF